MAFIDTRRSDVIDVNPNVSLEHYTLSDLLSLRASIERRLPAKALRDMNLERELILQHQASLELQNEVLRDDETPANQKSQVANATAAVLQQLIKLQETVYTTERLKSIENKLIEALNTLPTDVQERFLDAYEMLLRD